MEQSLIDFTNNMAVNHPILAYIFFFISASLQILFPPYPGDTVLVIEGYLSSKGYFNIYMIGLNAVTATFLSCILLYHISYKLGDRVFQISFIKKFFSSNKMGKITQWFSKYGSAAILLSKFVPGIGSLTMIVAGTFKVPGIKAYAAMGTASLIHNSFLLFLGKTTGDNMELIKYMFRRYNIFIVGVIMGTAALYLITRYYQRQKEPKKNL